VLKNYVVCKISAFVFLNMKHTVRIIFDSPSYNVKYCSNVLLSQFTICTGLHVTNDGNKPRSAFHTHIYIAIITGMYIFL
jgi:hypothetical protein